MTLQECLDNTKFIEYLESYNFDKCVELLDNKFERQSFIGLLEEEGIDFFKHITRLTSDLIDPNITTYTVGNNIITLGDYCFADCEDLTDINLPESLEYIGTGCFNSCGSLRRIIIPDKVRSLESYTFDWCSDLQTIRLGSDILSMGEELFYNINQTLTEIEYNGYMLDFISRGLVKKEIYKYSKVNAIKCLDGIIDLGRNI